MALNFQSYATLITKGFDPKEQIPFGPQFWINLPATSLGGPVDSDAKYITPNAAFDQLYQFSKQLEAQAAQYAGLAADAYRRTTQFNSGYQLELSMQGILDYNTMQIPFYKRGIKQLIFAMISVYNIYNSEKNIQVRDIDVIIPQIKVKQNILQQWQVWQKQLQAGIISKEQIIRQKYPEMDEEEIQKKINSSQQGQGESTDEVGTKQSSVEDSSR